MKKLLIIIMALIIQKAEGQQTLCDFDGIKWVRFGDHTGMLDSMFINPGPNPIDSSIHCAQYIKDITNMYDNFKIYSSVKMVDVALYANNVFSTPKMKVKVYSTAPIGTQIQLQLGSSTDNTYPTGIHSEYIGVTTAKNSWENITFNFVQLTPGSTTSSTNVDKFVIFFRPGAATNDTLYFDDLVGPPLYSASGIRVNESLPAFKLFQNIPNPAKDNTRINFQVNSPGYVSLKLYDLLGNPIESLLEEDMKPGTYSIPVTVDNIPNGIYFYVLKMDGISRSMKMIVSK